MALAKVELTCKKCGEKFEHRRNCRNRADAESYAAWAAENIDTCPGCYASAKKAAEMEMIAAQAAKFGFPELIGSEKQIAWANRIRYKRICASSKGSLAIKKAKFAIANGKDNELLDLIDQYKEDPSAKILLYAYKALTEPSAKWWIENQ